MVMCGSGLDMVDMDRRGGHVSLVLADFAPWSVPQFPSAHLSPCRSVEKSVSFGPGTRFAFLLMVFAVSPRGDLPAPWLIAENMGGYSEPFIGHRGFLS